MISAVADSCSVRLDKVNGKVYKFHALVFNPGKFGFTFVIAQYELTEELNRGHQFSISVKKARNLAGAVTARGDYF